MEPLTDREIQRQAAKIAGAYRSSRTYSATCLLCGVEIATRSPRRRYCSAACSQRAYRRRQRALRGRPARSLSAMTRDERLILEMLSHGAQPWQVAVSLRLSTGTTNRRICRLVVSLGARTRCHMVALAVAGGLVTLDDLAPPGRRT